MALVKVHYKQIDAVENTSYSSNLLPRLSNLLKLVQAVAVR